MIFENEYTNYKGVTSTRRIVPMKLFFGSTHYHPEEQYILTAYDIDKKEDRDFAMKDFKDHRQFLEKILTYFKK